MFYRPEFCCSCGEKIERVDWKPWTSRRFCDLCATKYPVSEHAPKLLIGVGFFIGILGAASYLQTPQASSPPITKRASLVQSDSQPARTAPNFKTTEPGVNQSQPSSPIVNANVTSPVQPGGKPGSEPVVNPEPVYYCGAETKKGTPCSRKVKGNVRCWQHKGMPAMLPAAKLLVSN